VYEDDPQFGVVAICLAPGCVFVAQCVG
jgi:hypothetical protein